MAYKRILKSTAYMGFSVGAGAVAAIARNKVVAVMYGSVCLGMIGLLNQHYTLLLQVCGLGLSNAALRHVSEHRAEHGLKPEAEALAFAFKLGFAALIICVPASFLVCYFSFGSMKDLTYVMLAGLAVPPAILSLAQVAILQARGEVALLAKAQSLASFIGLAGSVLLIFLLGQPGAFLSILLMPLVGLAVFCPSVPLAFPRGREWFKFTSADRRMAALGLASFGVVVLGNASVLVIRSSVVSQLGLGQAGLYFAAMAVAVNIPGFLFSSMFTDFYPRVAAAPDHSSAAKVTNDQLIAGMLLAGHLFAAILLWAEDLLSLFYSHEFRAASPLMEWLTWGVAFRLVSLPLGYWIMARCRPVTVMKIEGCATIIGTALALGMLPRWGLNGVGMAFFATSFGYTMFLAWYVGRRSADGLFRRSALLLLILALTLLVAKLCAFYFQSHLWKAAFYAIVAGVSAWGYRHAIRRTA